MLSIWVVVALILIAFLAKRLHSPIAKIPGPWLTKFTSLPIKYHEFTTDRRISKRGIICIPCRHPRIYASGGSGYDKTEFYDMFRQFGVKYAASSGVGSVLPLKSARTMFSTLDKYSHSQRKRELADRYAMSDILRETHVSAIRDRAQAFLSRCTAVAESVDVYVFLHCYALDCVTHFMFSPGGLDSLTNEKDFEIMEELTYHHSLQKNLLHYYLPALTPYFPSWVKPRRAPKTNAYVQSITAQEHPDGHSLLGRLTRKDSPLRHDQVAAECKDHMAAGIDTTGDGLCFLMWELSQSQNRNFQDRLYEELRTTAPDTPLEKLIYLEAVIKEGLRCAPPIPMSFPRYVPSGGRTIEGTFVPEGTIVSCQPYTVHRFDEGVFPEPDRFNPDRWMDEDGATERNRLFFAFGTGGRGCTGRNLAMVEMKLLLREVYSRYRTTVAGDMTGCMEIDDQIISSRPKGQTCRLTFTARE